MPPTVIESRKTSNDKISNETLYKNTKQESIVQTIQRRQLRFIGHCLRRDKEEFTYQYALYTPQV